MKKKLYIPGLIFVSLIGARFWLPYVTVFDQYILEMGIALRTPFLTTLFKIATYLGDTTIVFAVLVCVMVFFYKKGKHRDAKMVLASSVLGIGANLLIKDFVARSRPYSGFSLVSESSYSFPSAHATIAITLYFLFLWYTSTLVHKKNLRLLLRFFSVIVPMCLIMSRVYLGVHFPTDVVAGVILGIISIMFCSASFRKI